MHSNHLLLCIFEGYQAEYITSKRIKYVAERTLKAYDTAHLVKMLVYAR